MRATSGRRAAAHLLPGDRYLGVYSVTGVSGRGDLSDDGR